MACARPMVINDGDLFNASWSLGYLDASYDEYIDAFGNDVADQRVVQNTPDWTASLRLAYDTPFNLGMNEGNLLANVMASYRGDSSQFETPSAYLDQEAYTLLDASIPVSYTHLTLPTTVFV